MDYMERNIRPICLDVTDPERAMMISIITAKSCARIHLEDIEYIEQFGRKLEIFTGDLQYSVYDNINNLLPYFSRKEFFRAMKGMLINFDKVKNLEEDVIYFESGRCIAMGRNNFCRTRHAFKKYLKEYPTYQQKESKLMVAEQNAEALEF